MKDTLSQQLSKLFNDIDKIQSLGHQLSLKMFIEDATDETTAAFTDLMMLIHDIEVPTTPENYSKLSRPPPIKRQAGCIKNMCDFIEELTL